MNANEYKIAEIEQYRAKIVSPLKEAKDQELELALSHLLRQEKEKRTVRLSKIYNNWCEQISR